MPCSERTKSEGRDASLSVTDDIAVLNRDDWTVGDASCTDSITMVGTDLTTCDTNCRAAIPVDEDTGHEVASDQGIVDSNPDVHLVYISRVEIDHDSLELIFLDQAVAYPNSYLSPLLGKGIQFVDGGDIEIDPLVAIVSDQAPGDLYQSIVVGVSADPLALDALVQVVTNLAIIDADLGDPLDADPLSVAIGNDTVGDQSLDLFPLQVVTAKIDALGDRPAQLTSGDSRVAILGKNARFGDEVTREADAIDPVEEISRA